MGKFRRLGSGLIISVTDISTEKPLDGFVLKNITGTCAKAISLANVTHAELRNIHVTGYNGSLVTTTNVSGVGLEIRK